MKSLNLLKFAGLVILAAAALQAQSTEGAVYWSTSSALDCNANNLQEVQFTIPGGTTTVYSCYVTGTFVWLAAGGGYTTAIRVSGPASGAVGVDYSFYDLSGNNLNLDTNFGAGTATTSGNDVNFSLGANQPAEVDLLGATSNSPTYAPTTDGSVFVQLYCPDATTCFNVLPQLIYSAPPTISLSVPLAYDGSQWTQWSGEGVDDGGAHRISLVIYNQSSVSSIFTVRVFDSTGTQIGLGTTPAIPGYSSTTGEAGTAAFLLSDVVKTSLPSGALKVLVDGGSINSSVLMLQVNGRAIATLQTGYDTAPGTASSAASTPSTLRALRQGDAAVKHRQTVPR
jgi:hypothetical protein